ncbi:carboxylic acid reductase [Nocardia noduli]|uniref:carboxylic acid reductase n=1 Tax=Nocardia noduli TaxID=2815722 RepID=UPI001C217894|nr:carboxylic acid reductase [Nocardia noduli]
MPLAERMATVMQRYGSRPAIAERARELVHDEESGAVSVRLLPRYETVSYETLWERVQFIARALTQEPASRIAAGDRVAILGFADLDYITLDLACNLVGAVVVPLPVSAPLSQIGDIVLDTAPVLIAASIDNATTAASLAERSPSIEHVLMFSYLPEVTTDKAKYDEAAAVLRAQGTELVTMWRLPCDGQTPAPSDSGDDDLAMLIYTSGSTGTPKGAMYTDRLVAQMWGGDGWAEFFAEDRAISTLHYMPMSHVAGHSSVKNTFARGGTTYLTAASDLSTLLEDLALARPTEISLVPRVCELLYQHYRSRLAGLAKTRPELDAAAGAAEIRALIRDETLGGRVEWASCTSAPLSGRMREFIESILGFDLHILYGTTEVGGVMADGRILRPPVIDYKLADVPELGYSVTDRPSPRGELLLKSTSTVPGYYNNPALTATMHDADGYYQTGDIVEQVAVDDVRIIDRKSGVIKLSQGEFVALPSLEALYATSPLVHQIFLYGDSERSYLVGVVVPTRDALARYVGDDPRLTAAILSSFREAAEDSGRAAYEIPRGLIIEPLDFAAQSLGLVSDHRKFVRPRLANVYGERLRGLYDELEAAEVELLRAVQAADGSEPVITTVRRAALAVLGGVIAEIPAETTFRDLGGDSLSAVAMANLLEDTFSVTVPVDVVASAGYDLEQLAGYIERRQSEVSDRATFTSVHGSDTAHLDASDLRVRAFLTPGTVDAERAQPVSTVLLTGANGYLGRFLALEWMDRLAAVDGELVCVVRSGDARSAADRLRRVYASDPELLARFDRLAARVLRVVPGDISEARLGLSRREWDRLASEVDLIVHAGALVNHVLGYRDMFEANVVGTAELIGLATTGRRKAFTFLSSVAVAANFPTDRGAIDEISDIRTALGSIPLDSSYGSGYAASKWAGEVLLHDARETLGLDITIFRSSMILAHSAYQGALNVTDVFSRLLHTILLTGTAPNSFYRTSPTVAVQQAHYDGLPVDFTAKAVAALGDGTRAGLHTYGLVNPHDDGVSLDVVIDWLGELGYVIKRTHDYTSWIDATTPALQSLPDARQGTILPIIDRFAEPETAVRGVEIPSFEFESQIRVGTVPGYSRIPSVTPALIAKYAHDLEVHHGVRYERRGTFSPGDTAVHAQMITSPGRPMSRSRLRAPDQ